VGSKCLRGDTVVKSDLITGKVETPRNLTVETAAEEIPIERTKQRRNPLRHEEEIEEESNTNFNETNGFDCENHSQNIMNFLNEFRKNPSKQIGALQDLIKRINKKNNVIEINGDIAVEYQEEDLNTQEALDLLKNCEEMNTILCSPKVYEIAMEELKNIIDNERKELHIFRHTSKSLNRTLKGNFRTIKLLLNFVVDPNDTVLIAFLLHKENRQLLLVDNLYEGAVAVIQNEKTTRTLFYFIASKDLEEENKKEAEEIQEKRRSQRKQKGRERNKRKEKGRRRN